MRLLLMLTTSIFSTCQLVFLQIECKIKIKNSIFTTIFLFIYLLLRKKDINVQKLATNRVITSIVGLVCYGHDGRVLRTLGSEITARHLFPVWECFVPNVGIFFLLIVAKWPTLNLQKQKISEKPMDKGFQLGWVLPRHSTTHST